MMYILILLLTLVPSAVFAQTWPNLPSGASIFATNPMNDGCGGVSGFNCDYNDKYTGAIIQDSAPGPGATPPNSLQYIRTHSTTQNGGLYSVLGYNFPGTGLKSLYVGLWWKMSNPFYGWNICQNKLSL